MIESTVNTLYCSIFNFYEDMEPKTRDEIFNSWNFDVISNKNVIKISYKSKPLEDHHYSELGEVRAEFILNALKYIHNKINSGIEFFYVKTPIKTSRYNMLLCDEIVTNKCFYDGHLDYINKSIPLGKPNHIVITDSTFYYSLEFITVYKQKILKTKIYDGLIDKGIGTPVPLMPRVNSISHLINIVEKATNILRTTKLSNENDLFSYVKHNEEYLQHLRNHV